MISSMTGYGSSEFVDEGKSVSVEVRSVNNRFIKIKIKSPHFLRNYEQELENRLKQEIPRGSVTVAITYQSTTPQPVTNINIDNLANYFKVIQEAKNEIGMASDVSIDSLLSLPGVIENSGRSEEDMSPVKDLVCDLMSSAIVDLNQMKLKSGNEIKDEIEDRCKQIKVLLNNVEERVPAMVVKYEERLRERIGKLLEGTGVNLSKDDLCREVAVFADRSDITEEIKLLGCHVKQLNEIMNNGGQVGKKMEFVVQEMFRESNTMGSKSNEDELLRYIFDIKTEVEKIKELTLNIE